MADIEISYGAYTPITINDTKTVVLETNGKWMTDDVTIEYTKPSGGGNSETGTFVGVDADSVTIPVTALHSHISIYPASIPPTVDLSTAPYGNNKLFTIYADNNTGFFMGGGANYNGKSIGGQCGPIGLWGTNTSDANKVVFSADSIKITRIRIGGATYKPIVGETYNWVAW